ncbi:MAG: ROK family protein, partial [Opitutales bacterium]|nr:ROK family protein [Opitutales bacterium]
MTNTNLLSVSPKQVPVLDPNFVAASLWNRAFGAACGQDSGSESFEIALERTDGTVSRFRGRTLSHQGDAKVLNLQYAERLLKFLLWEKGGYRVYVSGNRELFETIKSIYAPGGAREFDYFFMGDKVYGRDFEMHHVSAYKLPDENEADVTLGRNLDGCRIGFDLGGSDRKCAALIDGEVVFSEEIKWDPYFEKDPSYHIEGVQDTLKRAAAKLPRVDAIGGSAAGVYVNNEVRVGSIFRGVPQTEFDTQIRRMFFTLKECWGGIPFEVVNDGEVTALAGAMSMNDNGVLGVSMGTSQAAGYVDPNGHIKPWLNELAFAPIDYSPTSHRDEWSGDIGVGAQYFSQQAVARLLAPAGIEVDETLGFPERLEFLQEEMKKGSEKAPLVYDTIGTYFGYAIAHYADLYDFHNLLILGRVTSG